MHVGLSSQWEMQKGRLSHDTYPRIPTQPCLALLSVCTPALPSCGAGAVTHLLQGYCVLRHLWAHQSLPGSALDHLGPGSLLS